MAAAATAGDERLSCTLWFAVKATGLGAAEVADAVAALIMPLPPGLPLLTFLDSKPPF